MGEKGGVLIEERQRDGDGDDDDVVVMVTSTGNDCVRVNFRAVGGSIVSIRGEDAELGGKGIGGRPNDGGFVGVSNIGGNGGREGDAVEPVAAGLGGILLLVSTETSGGCTLLLLRSVEMLPSFSATTATTNTSAAATATCGSGAVAPPPPFLLHSSVMLTTKNDQRQLPR